MTKDEVQFTKLLNFPHSVKDKLQKTDKNFIGYKSKRCVE